MRAAAALGRVGRCACLGGLLGLAAPVQAAPLPRYDATVTGDVVVIGSTIGHDCGAGLSPPAGATASCGGLGEADSAPDAYWQDNAAGGGAATAARTSANLDLPTGATVVRAQLYWAGMVAGTAGDATVTVDRDAGSATSLSNAEVQTITFQNGLGMATAYQATADVTALVMSMGRGVYRVTDIQARGLQGLTADDDLFGGWVLVVVYQLAGAPRRRISLHDGLTAVVPGTPASTTISGLALAGSTPAGTLGVWGYEGDTGESGDRININSVLVAGSTANPATNFFNGSRTVLGTAAAGAVPALSGAAGTLAGVDLDVVDISAHLSATTTDLAIAAATTDDRFYFGGLVASIALPPLPDAAAPVDATTPDTGAPPPDAAPDTRASDVGPAPGADAAIDALASDAAPADAAVTDAGADGSSADLTRPDGGADAAVGSSVRTVLGGSGCACRVDGAPQGGALPAAALAWLAAAAIRRRSRTRAGSAPGRARTP